MPFAVNVIMNRLFKTVYFQFDFLADSPFDDPLDQKAVKLIHAVDDLVNQATQNSRQPSQEDVVRCTEQITKKIQELLLSAQAGRHSW